MKTFQIVTLFCLIAASMAFAPNKAPQGEFSSRCVYRDLVVYGNEGNLRRGRRVLSYDTQMYWLRLSDG